MISIVEAFGWRPLAGAIVFATVFIILGTIKRLRKAMLSIAMLFMVLVTIVTAFQIASYEQAYEQGRSYECERQSRTEPDRPTRSAIKIHADGDPGADRERVKVQDEPQGDRSAIAIACEGNAIMRTSLRMQVVATIGGLVAAAMGIVGAFVAVIGYLDPDRDGRKRIGPDKIDTGAVAQHEHQPESQVRSQPKHSFLLSDFLVILTGLAIHSLVGRGRRKGGGVS